MSACVVMIPVLITAWPTLVAAVSAAAIASGFKVLPEGEPAARQAQANSLELEHENLDVVGDNLTHGRKIVIERNGVTLTFSRDERGRFTTCVKGSLAKADLKKIGEDMAGKVIQQYVYRRLSEELHNHGFNTMEEDQLEDQTIRMHVRRIG